MQPIRRLRMQLLQACFYLVKNCSLNYISAELGTNNGKNGWQPKQWQATASIRKPGTENNHRQRHPIINSQHTWQPKLDNQRYVTRYHQQIHLTNKTNTWQQLWVKYINYINNYFKDRESRLHNSGLRTHWLCTQKKHNARTQRKKKIVFTG